MPEGKHSWGQEEFMVELESIIKGVTGTLEMEAYDDIWRDVGHTPSTAAKSQL